MKIAIAEQEMGRAAFCAEVLDDLPEWFAIAESKAAYASACDAQPMFAASIGSERAGFVSLRDHNQYVCELYVIGVKRRWRRQGVGRLLVDAAVRRARRDGQRFLTVKTLAASHPDENYAETGRFYEAVGFLPLEEFPTLWGARTPCLMMIRPLH
ncbi:GNAT family N-acetyltransferase [Methylocystis sp.]|uniref:GNAT family N-acetyltransferase n=1 Tax=Methylocystis sp. TaxID=1911079 RepID=UPI0025FEB914|nr:GNAT family N-acetyltransferase [Methylocystis sp.]